MTAPTQPTTATSTPPVASDAPTPDLPSSTRHPRSEWLWEVEFPDAAVASDSVPVPIHVACRPVRFNGAQTVARIVRDTITVEACHNQATVVSFVVHGDDITWSTSDGAVDGMGPGMKIGDLFVLSPRDPDSDAWTWERDDSGPTPLVRVYVYVYAVSFPPR